MSHDLGRVGDEQFDKIEQPGEFDDVSGNNPDRYPATCGRCDARWHGHAVAHCSCCHVTFTSATGFDVHRYEGRCRSTRELQDLGYEPNSAGHWRKPIEAAPQHWGTSSGNRGTSNNYTPVKRSFRNVGITPRKP